MHSARAASRTAAGEAVRGGAILGGLAHKASTFRARRGWTSTLPAHKASTFPLGEENARSEASARRQRNDGEREDTGMREQGGGHFSARARRGGARRGHARNTGQIQEKSEHFRGRKNAPSRGAFAGSRRPALSPAGRRAECSARRPKASRDGEAWGEEKTHKHTATERQASL